MLDSRPTRRTFLGALSASAAALAQSPSQANAQGRNKAADAPLPALLGGNPVRRAKFSPWPIIGEVEIKAWIEVLRSGRWNRLNGGLATKFEQTWAAKLGGKHALATANGTSALFTALNALGVGPGDEVIVPSYTFVATINAVLLQHALPVFVDTDPETFQIDAKKIEAAITDKTACLLPAHIGGSPADLDTILALGAARKIPVIEDACQAHLAEWRGRKVGTLGTLGCFSFQASKNLNSGEGGAVHTDDDALIAACRSFHNNGRSAPGTDFLSSQNGCNLRITEFQAALLLAQLTRLDDQSNAREANAAALDERLKSIPGLRPALPHAGCSKNAYHLYMFRYDKSSFADMPRSKFIEALAAEGIPASAGYSPLTREPFLKQTLQSRGYRYIYSAKTLKDHLERMSAAGPVNDRLCEEAVWFTQTMLLGPRGDMDQIAEAIRKIQAHADRLAKM